MQADQRIHVDSAPHLLQIMQKMVELLVETRQAYGIVSIDEPEFIQVMALEDGALRLESSSSHKVLAANIGFKELVADHEHIAAIDIPAEWPAKESIAAETLATLAVKVHGVVFPTVLEFELDTVE